MEGKFSSQHQKGLTSEEVNDRIKNGLLNTAPERITKTNSQIIQDNVCTLFNLFNLIIAICLAFVGAYSNMFFILIIIVNICIGIIQEIHARNLVEKLSLISAPKASVIRDGIKQEISLEELVIDEILSFDAGKQVCTDSILLDGKIEVNESLLTGESDALIKKTGDTILSGSFVISGKCLAKAIHVGKDNYVSQIAHEAKKHKKIHSELLSSIRKVTKFTGFLIIPLGFILFWQAFFLRGDLLPSSVVSTAAALLGMLPKGLVLLISITLASGVIKLAKKQVLVQELFALESLAHVDVLCLDKTGTITEGNMTIQSVFQYENTKLPVSFETLMGSFLTYTDDNNATFTAVKNYFTPNKELKYKHKIPFSSKYKWSSISFDGIGTLVLGAPERLSHQQLPHEIRKEQENGSRILFVGFTETVITDSDQIPQLKPVALLSISDPIRKNAAETLAFFQKEGVALKIISGDHPITVSSIAKKAGLQTAEQFIDMSSVLTDEDLVRAAAQYSVFGRVSPHQKCKLVQAFKHQGHTVAMTGDGVNDILALREADCSIAMAEGSDAARQVSQLVLLNSDFSSLPDVLSEGRRCVNNVTRVAGIFFVKTIYSVLLSIICIISNMPFPFIPIQITLIDLAIEGYPSFFMSFESDNQSVNGSFLRSAFKKAIPNAFTIIANLLIVFGLAGRLGIHRSDMITIMYDLIGFVGIMAVWKACIPMNKLRMFLCITMSVGYYVAVVLFHSILHVEVLSGVALYLFFGMTLFSLAAERIFAGVTNRILK